MGKSPGAFRTISEVAEWLETPAHVLRFWETKFTQIKPVKRAGGRRYYRPADMQLVGGIKKLLHEDGMTIKGVQKLMRDKGVKHVSSLSQIVEDAAPAKPAGKTTLKPVIEQTTQPEQAGQTAQTVAPGSNVTHLTSKTEQAATQPAAPFVPPASPPTAPPSQKATPAQTPAPSANHTPPSVEKREPVELPDIATLTDLFSVSKDIAPAKDNAKTADGQPQDVAPVISTPDVPSPTDPATPMQAMPDVAPAPAESAPVSVKPESVKPVSDIPALDAVVNLPPASSPVRPADPDPATAPQPDVTAAIADILETSQTPDTPAPDDKHSALITKLHRLTALSDDLEQAKLNALYLRLKTLRTRMDLTAAKKSGR